MLQGRVQGSSVKMIGPFFAPQRDFNAFWLLWDSSHDFLYWGHIGFISQKSLLQIMASKLESCRSNVQAYHFLRVASLKILIDHRCSYLCINRNQGFNGNVPQGRKTHNTSYKTVNNSKHKTLMNSKNSPFYTH